MWNLLSAIGRKVQSWLPQAPPVSPKISVPTGTKITQPQPQDLTKLSVVGAQQSPLQQAAAQSPAVREAINVGAQAGGGPPSGGGGTGFTTDKGIDQSATRGRNVGDTIYIDGKGYRVIDPSKGLYEPQWSDPSWNEYKRQQAAEEAQRKAAIPAPVVPTPVPTPTPTSAAVASYQAPAVASEPLKFDPAAYLRKLQETATSAGQKLTTSGSNLLGAISRTVGVPTAYAGDRGTVIPEGESWNEKLGKWVATLGTFGSNILGRDIRLGGGGSSLGANIAGETSPYFSTTQNIAYAKGENPYSWHTPSFSEKYGKRIWGTSPSDLPVTPPPLGDGGLGGAPTGVPTGETPQGEEQPQLFPSIQNQEVRDMILEAIASSSNEVANMPIEDLDAAYTQMADELGITKQQAVLNDLNTQVLAVTDELDAIDGDVTREAGNVLMTEDQRRRLVSARAKPLREQLIKLMRSAQYAGVGLDSLINMLNQRMEAKKATMTTQFQAAQLAQQAEEQRKNRLLSLLPYVKPTAQKLTTGGGGGRVSSGGGRVSSGGGDEFEATLRAAGLSLD